MDQMPQASQNGLGTGRVFNVILLLVALIIAVSAVVVLGQRAIENISFTEDREYFEAGKIAFQNKNYIDAVYNFRMAAAQDKDNAEIQALLARSLAAQVHPPSNLDIEEKKRVGRESLVHFNKAIELGLGVDSAEYSEFLFSYLITSLFLGEYDQAEQVFGRMIDHDSVASAARLRMGDAYINLIGKPELARDVLLPIFSDQDLDRRSLTEANFLMMRLSTYFENIDDIERYANNVLAGGVSGEDLVLVYTNLAGAYSRRGDVEKAKELIQRAEEEVGEVGRFACNLANVYFTNKEFDLALEEAKKREHPICWSLQAKVYLERGDKERARMYAQKALDAIMAIEIKDIFAVRAIQNENEILQKAAE